VKGSQRTPKHDIEILQSDGRRTMTSSGKSETLNVCFLHVFKIQIYGGLETETPVQPVPAHRTITVLKWFFKSVCGSTKNHHLWRTSVSFEAPL